MGVWIWSRIGIGIGIGIKERLLLEWVGEMRMRCIIGGAGVCRTWPPIAAFLVCHGLELNTRKARNNSLSKVPNTPNTRTPR